MTFNWNEMFGEDYFIEIKNSERKYFGLNEIAGTWQTAVYYSTQYDYRNEHKLIYFGSLCSEKIFNSL